MRTPRGTMFYDPYTVLARRDDALYTSSHEVPRYMTNSASSHWSGMGSAIQGPNARYESSGEHRTRPVVTVTFTTGKEYELRPIERAAVDRFQSGISDILEQSNLPALKHGDMLYIVHSNKVSAIGVGAVPGTRVHIIKRRTQGLSLNDVELTTGSTTIDAFPSVDDKFVLVIMRACGYFACNYKQQSAPMYDRPVGHQGGWVHRNHRNQDIRDMSRVVRIPHHKRYPYHDEAPTLSNLPGSHLLPNSPYVTVAW